MNTNNYAWAITDGQITRRIHSWSQVEIQAERENFDEFCAACDERGVFFHSQLEAREAYNYQFPMNAFPNMQYVDHQPLVWEDELKQEFEKRAQFGNYNETGGQQ